jgi:hypothetical protein
VNSLQERLSGLTREELQRALGVKPMDKSSKYRGVSKKKGKWEAKVMLNRKWAYRWALAMQRIHWVASRGMEQIRG